MRLSNLETLGAAENRVVSGAIFGIYFNLRNSPEFERPG
jgi:hypothetical protein